MEGHYRYFTNRGFFLYFRCGACFHGLTSAPLKLPFQCGSVLTEWQDRAVTFWRHYVPPTTLKEASSNYLLSQPCGCRMCVQREAKVLGRAQRAMFLFANSLSNRKLITVIICTTQIEVRLGNGQRAASNYGGKKKKSTVWLAPNPLTYL